MQAKLSSRSIVTGGTYQVDFLPVSDHLDIKPGQFFTLTLSDPIYTDERGNSRHFGLINLPDSTGRISTVFRAGPSAFKRTLIELPIGTQVEISDVGGHLSLSDNEAASTVMITGGIGLAPLVSLLHQAKKESFSHPISLIYSNTIRDWAIFLPWLESLSDKYPNFTLKTIMTKDPVWTGLSTRLNKQSFPELIPDFLNPRFMVTGTPRFVPDMVKLLKEFGVDMNRMIFEIFSGY